MDSLDKIPNPVAKAWFKLALAHGQRRESFCEIAHGSPEHKSWAVYFWQLGWSPVTFGIMTPQRTWTAPCRWPNDLPAFEAPAVEQRFRPVEIQMPRPTADELDAQFKRLGLSRLRPGSKCDTRQARHSADERREAQAILDRYEAEAQRRLAAE